MKSVKTISMQIVQWFYHVYSKLVKKVWGIFIQLISIHFSFVYLDSVKEEICSSLFYYKLINLCEKYAGEDEEFIREACYILVVLITIDKSIDHLLNSNHSNLLDYGISWLEKSNLQLKMTGALLITNLTRNDQAAVNILADKRQPVKKLIEQLKSFTNELENKSELMSDEQAKVAHGILGALRNLAIPGKWTFHWGSFPWNTFRLVTNRALLVENDAFDPVIPYLFTKNFNGEIAYKGSDEKWLKRE